MIISEILGGLGNQMFQYAAGRALSLSQAQPLLLDLNGFDTYGLHNGFEIDRVFAAPVDVASKHDVRDILGWRANGLVRKLLKRTRSSWLHGDVLTIEPHFNYWPDLLFSKAPRYLTGYWQSEKYFKSFEEVLRTDFRFRKPLDGQNIEIAGRIESSQSVGLHVRRGDYISSRSTMKVLKACPLDYYESAISHVARLISFPTFFVFSDDAHWAKENLAFPVPTEYVSNNKGKESYLDMQLLSLCKHQIISNSTFSWWGAWLSSNSGKITVAPKIWFSNEIDDSDLIPSEWTRL